MPNGIDTSDPCCPDCKQWPLVSYALPPDGDKLLWCAACGVLVEVTYTGTNVDRIEIRRPTHPRLDALANPIL